MSSIVKQINDQSIDITEHGENDRGGYKFEFKHKGHRIQHSCNSEIIGILVDLES